MAGAARCASGICPDDAVRDGERALALAQRLNAHAPHSVPYVGTLAAAYAAEGAAVAGGGGEYRCCLAASSAWRCRARRRHRGDDGAFRARSALEQRVVDHTASTTNDAARFQRRQPLLVAVFLPVGGPRRLDARDDLTSVADENRLASPHEP